MTRLEGEIGIKNPSVKHKTLSAYYPSICRIQHLFQFELITRIDPPEYIDLVSTALIAFREGSRLEELKSGLQRCDRYYASDEPRRGHQDLIDGIMVDVSRKGKNVLSMAPRDPARVFEESLPGKQHLTTPLHSRSFRHLRSKIGDQAFRNLIVHTSVFLPVGNNSYRQITGLPIYDLPSLSTKVPPHSSTRKDKGQKRKRGREVGREVKRRKSDNRGVKPTAGVLGNGQSSAEVLISRQRIFYGHPAKVNKGRSVPGLHPQHVLNSVFENDKMIEDGEVQLVRAIFPRYRLDADLPLKPRIQGIMKALKGLAVRQRGIDYASQLRICVERCFDRTVDGLQSVSHDQVTRYITSILRQIHGGVIFGALGNLQVICRHARELIEAKQFEPITLHCIMRDVRVTDFTWLSGDTARSRTNLAESKKQKEMVEQFVFWLFNDYLVPLIRNSFYVTETASTRYQTVYYTHDEWSQAVKPHFAKLQEDLLEPLSMYEQVTLGQSQLGVSAVRLVPKPNGFRPIVNLGRKVVGRKGLMSKLGAKKQSANEALRGIHQVLTFEKERNRDILGSSLFGTNEIFAPLSGLRNELMKLYGHIPRLYFVKMDIKAAFDTIKQDFVLRVIDSLMEQDWEYALVQYCLLLPPASEASQGSSRRLFKTRAVVEGNNALCFEDLAKEIARPLRNAVVIDMMRKTSQSRRELMNLLRQHIKNNIWQIGNRYYRQREGIPQGSKISSMLCSIFYASLERQHLSFLTKPGSRLLRYIDDFLYITDDYTSAKRFSAIMSNGFPEYGAFISPGKTMTSFEWTRGQVAPICPLDDNGNSLFPYCGFLIDTKSLELRPDVPRIIAGDMEQSFALRSARHRGKAFIGWLSRQLENRNHIAYLDTIHNTLPVVYLNIWLNFATTAMKIPHYFAKREDISPHHARVIFDSICTSVEYTHVAGRARVRHSARTSKDGEDHYKVRKFHFEYLAKSAIVRVLTRKAARFKDVLYLLRNDLMGQEYRAIRDRFVEVERKGWDLVKSAKY